MITHKLPSRHSTAGPPPIATFKIEVVPGMTWRDVGKQLRTRLMESPVRKCDCRWCSEYHRTKRGKREHYWVQLVSYAAAGDPSGLIKHFNSRRVITPFDRETLAVAFEVVFAGELPREVLQKKGRPKNVAAIACSQIALMFYDDWKWLNSHIKISDWGHSDEMKHEACEAAIEYHSRCIEDVIVSNHPLNVVPRFDAVRELMDRPRTRRGGMICRQNS